GGLPAGFRRVQVRKKSLQSCSTSVWGADYRRYGCNLHLFVWISLLGYCSHPVLSPFFLQGFIFMSQSTSVLRKGGFTFKQFFVAHDRCAMKVGTDGVLLGAWAPVDGVQSVLDIGSGSGLIALMLAQRNTKLRVDAVELDSDAAVQAQGNFTESPWAERLHVINQDIVSYSQLHSVQYDLIVSNPPYFEPAVACRDEKRDQARYTATLTHDVLLESAKSC